jgi:glycosyltransferase involved in cell wall biosynthesis
MVDKKISLVITTYNRDTLTINSYSNVIEDDRISEVVIVDDKSNSHYVDKLRRHANHPKIKLFLNQNNLGCYRNKRYAISLASNEYVIILDSDNTIDKSYIDVIYSQEWDVKKIIAPDFAMPHFDYREFSGKVIDKDTVKQYIPRGSRTRFDCLINTMNYFVNRDEYLRVWDGNIEPWTADTIYQNYQWLKAGNYIYVAVGMQYNHLVHDGSHYKNNVHHTGNLYKEIENKLMRL